MTRIIAAVDNSAATRGVLDTAVALAPVLGASVEAVQVSENGGHTAEAEAATAGVPFRRLGGVPLERLQALAAGDDVAAVVMGTRGRPTGRRPAGHLALALAESVDKPVVMVPPDRQVPARVGRVLVAMEGRPGKERRLKRAVELGTGAGLELVVVHVDDEDSVPSFSDQVQYEHELYAQEFLARYCPGCPEAQVLRRVGDPAHEILAAADSVGPDVIALGCPHSHDGEGAGVVREVLDRSHVPVLLVAVD